MPSYFRTARNVELSTVQFLETQIEASWSSVTVIKSFSRALSKDTTIPIVCIRMIDQTSTRLEIGTDTLENRYGIVIDIFAKSDAQRLDLADFIVNELKDGWIFLEFAHVSGDQSQVTTTANGRLRVMEFTENHRLDFGEQVEFKDRYRHVLAFIVRKNI